jgi:hypothetical protein
MEIYPSRANTLSLTGTSGNGTASVVFTKAFI